jgi:hypothetical protein
MATLGVLPFFVPSLINITNDRINSAEIVNEYRHLMQTLDGPHWLKQANGIFNGLGITCGFEDFGTGPVTTRIIIVMIISDSLHRFHRLLGQAFRTDR